jgi:hypothetical protein
MDLDDNVGVPAHIFWSMMDFCGGCNHIMAGCHLDNHACDLDEVNKKV